MKFNKNKLSTWVALVLSGALTTTGAATSASTDHTTGVDVTAEGNVNSTTGTDVRHITFIHTSDLHGDLHPHDNSRDGQASEGGIARVATVIKQIRNSSQNSFYVHTGDTIQGSAQALFTRGQAVVDIVNLLGVDAFAPGNWEHTYGLGRFRELFLGTPDDPETPENEYVAPKAPWNIMAVNSYYNGEAGNPARSGVFADPGQPYTTGNETSTAGNLVVTPYNGKPYRVVTIDGVKVGMFGCTTNRGPQIVGSNVTKGVTFTNCKGQVASANNKPILWPAGGHANQDPANPGGFNTVPEVPKYVDILRNQEGVDVVILLSEGGLAENIYNAEHHDGIDIIFSSDMHEETNYPVVVTTPNGGTTLVVENGEDGAQVGEIAVKLKKKAGDATYSIESWKWKEHDVTNTVLEDPVVAAAAHEINEPFEGTTFDPSKFEANPFNGTKPAVPLDTVIGTTEIEISRNRFSFEHPTTTGHQPGVIEGTGHSLITDAFRVVTNALLPANEQTGLDANGNITPSTEGTEITTDDKYLIGAIRGFRYVNSYPPGSPITYEDLYHFLSIGPQVAVTELTAGALNNQTESAADSCMNPDVTKWAGGWFFNFSGVTMRMNPYGVRKRTDDPGNTGINDPLGFTSEYKLGRTSLGDDAAGLKLTAGPTRYRYASYYYETAPTQVNNISPAPNSTIRKIMRRKGTTFGEFAGLALVQVQPTLATDYSGYENVDATEVVAVYIEEFLGGTITAANLPYPRIELADNAGNPLFLPDTRQSLGFPTVEPVWGARAVGTPAYDATYGQVNYTGGQIDQD